MAKKTASLINVRNFVHLTT